MDSLRVGIVGLGANTRLRHVPGLRECDGVEIVSVCNRRPESTAQAARDFSIPKIHADWRELVADDDIDAVVIGTWPCLHCDVTLAALAAGKHVLVEARMARNADEARRMLQASQDNSQLVTQIVPSPLGLKVHRRMRQLLQDGYLGELREVVVLGCNGAWADPQLPLHWRQSEDLSGINMLALGILHETLIRWIADPVRVQAQTQIFTPRRRDPESGQLVSVTRPETAHVLAEFPDGAHGIYHLSSVMHHAPPMQIRLCGTEGTLQCVFGADEKLLGARRTDRELREIEIPPQEQGGWRVEADFVGAIRGTSTIEFTDFGTGVRYMEFTEAVAESALEGRAIELPAHASR